MLNNLRGLEIKVDEVVDTLLIGPLGKVSDVPRAEGRLLLVVDGLDEAEHNLKKM